MMTLTPHAPHCKHIYIFTLCSLLLLHDGLASWLNREPISTLPDGVDHVVAACQEDNLFLQCRNRFNKIFIKDVFYGRDNDFTCKSKVAETSNKCQHLTPPRVTSKVHLMCDGENKCKIPVTPEFLEKEGEEICPLIRKYLRVQYVCHQQPKIIMFCHNGCPSSCWPSCKRSCCQPPPPPPPPQSPITCPAGCLASCAPMCSTSCCEIQTVAASLPSIPTLCPGLCSSDCAPLCTEACCKTRKTTSSMLQFNQPPPTIQYNRHQGLTCTSMCSPSNCLPSCSTACCTPLTMQVLSCPAGCPGQCAPTCLSSCCESLMIPPQQLMLPPLPLPPSPPQQTLYCPDTCSSHCAPLCSPTCCQSSQIAQSQSHCGLNCPYQCAPLCSPTCCSQGMPPQQFAVPLIPMVPMMQLPQQPVPQYPVYQPPQPAMLQTIPQQKSCSMKCLTTCLPSCPRRCCVPLGDMSAREIQQRKTYQQMLQRFRAKQMQAYIGK